MDDDDDEWERVVVSGDRARIYGGWKEAMSDRLENLMSRASELVVSRCCLEPCTTGRACGDRKTTGRRLFA
jgi:hypothetical protein